MESVLIAGSQSEARAWQRHHPDRWSVVVAANHASVDALRGLQIESIHIAPGAVNLGYADLVRAALDVWAWSGATCDDLTGTLEPVYLDRTPDAPVDH